MSYGFRCAHCGHQETSHDAGLNYDGHCKGECHCGERKRRGYHFSFNSCPGFKYSRRDEGAVAQEYSAERIRSQNYVNSPQLPFLPDYLVVRAEKLERRHWRGCGYKDGSPSPKFSSDIWLLTLSGVVINIGS